MCLWWKFSPHFFGLHYDSKVDTNHFVMGMLSDTHAEGRLFQKQAIGF